MYEITYLKKGKYDADGNWLPNKYFSCRVSTKTSARKMAKDLKKSGYVAIEILKEGKVISKY
jgi:hypothetical protein